MATRSNFVDDPDQDLYPIFMIALMFSHIGGTGPWGGFGSSRASLVFKKTMGSRNDWLFVEVENKT